MGKELTNKHRNHSTVTLKRGRRKRTDNVTSAGCFKCRWMETHQRKTNFHSVQMSSHVGKPLLHQLNEYSLVQSAPLDEPSNQMSMDEHMQPEEESGLPGQRPCVVPRKGKYQGIQSPECLLLVVKQEKDGGEVIHALCVSML